MDRVVQKTTEQKTSKVNVQQVRQRKKRRILPPVLQGLMGEANLRFAKGEIDLATKICMEIIRQVLLIYYIDNNMYYIDNTFLSLYYKRLFKNIKHLLIISSDKYQAPQNRFRH